jgi:hypothetical protein
MMMGRLPEGWGFLSGESCPSTPRAKEPITAVVKKSRREKDMNFLRRILETEKHISLRSVSSSSVVEANLADHDGRSHGSANCI